MLQDLSQPKSEASPPEGLLAVPLLRHQVWSRSLVCDCLFFSHMCIYLNVLWKIDLFVC